MHESPVLPQKPCSLTSFWGATWLPGCLSAQRSAKQVHRTGPRGETECHLGHVLQPFLAGVILRSPRWSVSAEPVERSE